jgi:hypothetical protein
MFPSLKVRITRLAVFAGEHKNNTQQSAPNRSSATNKNKRSTTDTNGEASWAHNQERYRQKQWDLAQVKRTKGQSVLSNSQSIKQQQSIKRKRQEDVIVKLKAI